MVNNRFGQIRNTQMYYSGREELEANILDNNIILMSENPDLENDVYSYINQLLEEDNGSLRNINNIIENLRNFKGLNFDDSISLRSMLFNIIIHTVLLPDYCEKYGTTQSLKEVGKIIEQSVKSFEKKVEFILKLGYTLEMGNIAALLEEIESNLVEGLLPLAPRYFNISERGLIGNVFNFSLESNNYEFNIIINGAEKLNNQKKAHTKKSIESFLRKYGLSNSLIDIKVHDGGDYENIKVDGVDNKDLVIISISHKSMVSGGIKDTYTSLINLIQVNNQLISNLSNDLGYPINGGVHLFSEGGSIDIKSVYPDFFKENIEDQKLNKIFRKLELDLKGIEYKLSDIGGLEEEKEEIEKIIFSINNDHILKSWSSDTVKGIIFEGPAGTGKTLFAKVIASQLDTRIFNIKISDIMSGAYINEGVGNIKLLFKFLRKEAKKSGKKVIVILDEIDALFKSRGNTANKSDEDIKIVNTFLTELGGIEDDDNIMFIGTTNLIDSIDDAVIRSGRLSHVIKISPPNEEGIKQIYEIHINKAIKKSKKAESVLKDIDINELAKLSKGLTGADIEEIVRNILEQKAYEEMRGLKITKIVIDDFQKVINKIKQKKINNTKSSNGIGFLADVKA